MDPLQFAYQSGIRVDVTIIFLTHRALSHLEKPGSTRQAGELIEDDGWTTSRTVQGRLKTWFWISTGPNTPTGTSDHPDNGD